MRTVLVLVVLAFSLYALPKPLRAQGQPRFFKVCSAQVPAAISAEKQKQIGEMKQPGRLAALPNLLTFDAQGLLQRQLQLQGAILAPEAWGNGSMLRIKFMNGEPAVTKRIEASARAWEQVANIRFVFVGGAEDADIRIKIDSDNNSWSHVGKEAQRIAKNQETMHFGWLHSEDSQAEYDSVVLHEFGHAIGLIHEHQSPAGGMQWDAATVYDYAARQWGWSTDQVDRNILNQYAGDDAIFTRLDPESIMMYAFPSEWTKDKVSMPWNYRLSKGDLLLSSRIYSRPTP